MAERHKVILLDTNVISELMRQAPNPTVVNWVGRQDIHELYTSSVNEAEIRYGAAILPEGRRKNVLMTEIQSMLEEDFALRILPFNSDAAKAYANVAASQRAAGRPINYADCMIAAIASVEGASVATRNVEDFDDVGIQIINPWAN